MLDGEVAGVHVGVGAAQIEEAGEFGEGVGVVFDAEIDDAVLPGLAAGVGLDDEHGGGLTAADVAAGGLCRVEGGEESVGEVALGGLEGGGHRLGYGVWAHEIRLHGIDGAVGGLACDVAGVGDAVGAGVGGDVAGGIDEGDLADAGAGVGGGERGEGLLGGAAGAYMRSRPSGP